MRNYILLLAFCFTLSACALDPRNAADAYATQSQADQAAQTAEQQRSLALQTYLAQSPADVAAHNRLVNDISIVGSFALGMLILAGAIGAAWVMLQSGRAAASYAQRRAIVSANLIPLDPLTRQYPLFIFYEGKGSFTLTNPNTGQTLLLDTHNPADRQAISASAYVQAAGVLAVQARKSHNPDAVALLRPTVIDVKEPGLEVGVIWEHVVERLNRSENV